MVKRKLLFLRLPLEQDLIWMFEALGAEINLKNGYIEASAKKLQETRLNLMELLELRI